jgi:8-oxo-dGTP diphosphatase
MKIVTAAILEDNGRFLIARRSPGQSLEGYWEFPGGKVEQGESLEECLTREIKEELNLDICVKDMFHEVFHQYDKGEIKLVAFKTQIISGSLSLSVHDEVKWLPPGEILQYKLAPADIPIAERL